MASYRLVRALRKINHDGWHVPGESSQDFVCRLEQASALEALNAVTILGPATAPLKTGPVKGNYRDGVLESVDDGTGNPMDFGGGDGSGGGAEHRLQVGTISTPVVAAQRGAYMRALRNVQILDLVATLDTPSLNGALTIDVRVDGLSILTAPLRIDQGEKSSNTAAQAVVIGRDTMYRDSEVTVAVTAPGVGAQGLAVNMLTRAATLPEAPLPPQNTTPPSTTGVTGVANVLAIVNGLWTNAPLGYSPWMQRNAGTVSVPDWVDIDESHGANYTQQPADAGRQIRPAVLAANEGGSNIAYGAPLEIPLPVPECMAAPVEEGSHVEGQTLNSTSGTWRYNPTAFEFKHQTAPLDDPDLPTDIPAANKRSFKLTAEQVGLLVRSAVRATNVTGQSAWAYGDWHAVEPSKTSAAWPPATPDPGTWPENMLYVPGPGANIRVGSGQTYTDLIDVPWLTLQPGDTVHIDYRDEDYRCKIPVAGQGTAELPIVIRGMRDFAGRRPTINGENAVTPTCALSPDGINNYFYDRTWTEDLGLVYIYRKPGDPDQSKPKYIQILGLKLTGASTGNQFTDQFGSARGWGNASAGIWAQVYENLLVEDCEITENGNGFFSNTKDDIERHASYFTIIRRCHIHENGNAGSGYEHNIYMQCVRPLIEGCDIGNLRPGATGSSIKDRSSGTVIRYNRIRSASRAIDLVDTEGGATSVMADPLYKCAWVYGNYIINDLKADPTRSSSANMVHWGGDNDPLTFRNGTLYFYNNTVIINADVENFYHIGLFDLSNSQCRVEMAGNIIAKYGTAYLHLAGQGAVIEMRGTNWITAGWVPAWGGTASVIQSGTLIEGTDPGLVPGTWHIAEGSPVLSLGLGAPSTYPVPSVQANLQVLYQPVDEGVGYLVRVPLGAGSDLGCFETDMGEEIEIPPPGTYDEPDEDGWFTFDGTDGQAITALNPGLVGNASACICDGAGNMRVADASAWAGVRVRYTAGQGQAQTVTLVRAGGAFPGNGSELRVQVQDNGDPTMDGYSARFSPGQVQFRRNNVYLSSPSHSIDWTQDVTIVCAISEEGDWTTSINGVPMTAWTFHDTTPLTGGFPGWMIYAAGNALGHLFKSFKGV